MVAVRLDRRLAHRIDPSDVVQEALADAAHGLSDYLRRRPLPFAAWLRQFAWDRLMKLHRDHIRAQKRSVLREESVVLPLSDDSVALLAQRLLAPGSTPSARLIRAELRDRLHAALGQLAAHDREVLVMRNLESLPVAEIAEVLGITPGAVKVRHLRALQRLRKLLDDEDNP
jgi:RNA polymerase sigma-70 factor (ECF subfamily)